MTSVIVGARKLAQLRDNLGASDWRLEGEALARLNEVSHLPDRYPEAMEKNMHERRDSAVDMPSLDADA
jgi:diketogulonate reductase-like aldo/keto reductase